MDFMKQRSEAWKPLEKRTYRYKKSAMEFFCPLCRTQRNFSINFRLSPMNYVQMVLITVLFTAATFSLWGFRGALVFFLIWPAFEFVRRALYKKEIPCPHCGFDASWYKKDVKVARKLVSDFWDGHPKQPNQGEPEIAPHVAAGQTQQVNDNQAAV